MKYTSFGSNTVQVANLPAQTIATLQPRGSHLYGNGADAALLIEWRRHYTMSLGLLQFHLSSDLNLTSKTSLFSSPAGQRCCLPSCGVLPCLPPSQQPHTANLSLLFLLLIFLKLISPLILFVGVTSRSLFLRGSGRFYCWRERVAVPSVVFGMLWHVWD